MANLRGSGAANMESMNLGNVAQVALARGAIQDAAEAFEQALRVAEEIESRWNLANAIAGAAAVSAARSRFEAAAQLMGAADAECERSGHPRLPNFCLFAQTQGMVRGMLGTASFQAAWDAGHMFSEDEAIAAARALLAEAQA